MALEADDPRHGTTNGYGNLGCRCQPCRDAWSVWHLEYMQRTPSQRWKGKVRERARRGVHDMDTFDRRKTTTLSDLLATARKLIEAGDIPTIKDLARLSGYSESAVRNYFGTASDVYAACGYRLVLVPADDVEQAS